MTIPIDNSCLHSAYLTCLSAGKKWGQSNETDTDFQKAVRELIASISTNSHANIIQQALDQFSNTLCNIQVEVIKEAGSLDELAKGYLSALGSFHLSVVRKHPIHYPEVWEGFHSYLNDL